MCCANAIWGLMSPVAKIVIASGAATSLVVTDLRFFGAMILFWLASFFQKPEHVNHRDMAKSFWPHCWPLCSTKVSSYSAWA